MKINCLSCGHNIDLDDAYAEHYEGEIKCYGCNAALEIRTEQSAIRSVRLKSEPADRIVSAEAYSQTTAEDGAKDRKPRPDTARNQLKPGAAALSGSGMQHGSTAKNRAA